MGHEVTIGGERLGAGRKMKATLHAYDRSTHQLDYVWRSTMAAGTLVPFMTEVALPGDTFDINLNVDVLTHPTIGPLFGSYKIQLDVFQVPIRLYQGKLHMNMLGIGMDMSNVHLPQVKIESQELIQTKQIDNQQINPSAIFSYLGIRGNGYNLSNSQNERLFNAIPYLAYWDIYKNYYANKQEVYGMVIHSDPTPITFAPTNGDLVGSSPALTIPVGTAGTPPGTYLQTLVDEDTRFVISGGTGYSQQINIDSIIIQVKNKLTGQEYYNTARSFFKNWTINTASPQYVVGEGPTEQAFQAEWGDFYIVNALNKDFDTEPQLQPFELAHIDDMRKELLAHLTDVAFEIDASTYSPYGLSLVQAAQPVGPNVGAMQFSQEGLALKTYSSDLFNNWIDTEWIDGVDGISAITAVSTVGDSFTIDELNLSTKIYKMLNRIAISGGSYDDWLDAVYTENRTRSAENPMYLGGLIRNLVFQEVVSNSKADEQPLGTLAGRGKVGNTNKGGHIIAKIDEPSYLMGIVSLTPNIDYSQGNKWDVNLKTLNDLHKPALDEIGFQDLITDQMAWFDTLITAGIPTFKSAGKQPAWVNYMTNVNVVRGNFADQQQQMFMVLNRRYSAKFTGSAGGGTFNTSIADLTTYIDPSLFNHIFADTRRDGQNFWTQIGVNIEARRKMSAKIMPNL